MRKYKKLQVEIDALRRDLDQLDRDLTGLNLCNLVDVIDITRWLEKLYAWANMNNELAITQDNGLNEVKAEETEKSEVETTKIEQPQAKPQI